MFRTLQTREMKNKVPLLPTSALLTPAKLYLVDAGHEPSLHYVALCPNTFIHKMHLQTQDSKQKRQAISNVKVI